jgi:hypothetical protein
VRVLACLLLVLTYARTPVLAQDNHSDIHQTTTPPVGARFEIVQSELTAKSTFRLDRFTGHVSELVKTKGGDYSWDDTEVVGLSVSPQSNRARFQIFTSGIAARFTFLIDSDTGKTWYVATTTEKLPDGTEQETRKWYPFVS